MIDLRDQKRFSESIIKRERGRTLSALHRLQVARFGRRLIPFVMPTINDGQRGGEQIVDRHVVEGCNLDHDVFLTSFRPQDMSVGGNATAIAKVVCALMPAHEAAKPIRLGM